MKILAMFIEKNNLYEFSIQELLSLFQIFNIPTTKLFKYESDIPEIDYPFLTPHRFPNFPFVVLDIPLEFHPKLSLVLERAASLTRFTYVLASGPTQALFQEDLIKNNSSIIEETESALTFCLDVKTHNFKLSCAQKIERQKNLNLPLFKGKCDLENPQRVFIITENYTIHGVLTFKFLAKSLLAVRKIKPYFTKYNLTDRVCLGPTSTTAELAFMMCNQALVSPASTVFDPFVGTGSILISATYFGAICYGTDIDMRVLQGYAVAQLNKKSSFFGQITPLTKNNVFLNFKQYCLPVPEILRADCSSHHFKYSGLFDSIICDPPYGIRAAAKQTSLKSDEPDVNIHKDNYIIPTAKSNCLELTNRLFSLANENLKINGRLVFLYPVLTGDDPLEDFKCVLNFELVSATKNKLCTGVFARYLFTFKKIN